MKTLFVFITLIYANLAIAQTPKSNTNEERARKIVPVKSQKPVTNETTKNNENAPKARKANSKNFPKAAKIETKKIAPLETK
jgi:hypothetical protein